MKPDVIIALIDVRSAHNVGAIMRTADATGAHVWTVGLTPHPPLSDDPRPPHVADRAARMITKTALGAEESVGHRHFSRYLEMIAAAQGRTVLALEQAAGSSDIFDYHRSKPVLLLAGSETAGLDADVLGSCEHVLELPMRGLKESLNVAVAAGIALYQLR